MYMEFYSLVTRLAVNISKYRNSFALSFALIFFWFIKLNDGFEIN